MFDRRLQQVLDDRGTPSEDRELVSHALECERCERLLAAQARLFAGLHDSSYPPPRAGLARSIVERAERTQSITLRLTRIRRLTRTACAAAIGLAVLGAWLLNNNAPPSKVVNGPASNTPGTPPAPPQLAAPSAPTVWPLDSLAVPYAAQLSGGESSEGIQQAIQNWYRNLGEKESFEPVHDLTGSLRPIASTVHAALGTIWSAIPKPKRADDQDNSSSA